MMTFGGPIRPGDRVTVECDGKKYEGCVEEISFRAGEEVHPGLIKASPLKLTVALIREIE